MAIARRYIAKGLPASGRFWHGQFAWPGQTTHYVRDETGQKILFASEADAADAAGIALARKLVDRREQPSGKNTMELYDRIPGPEIAAKLAEIGMTPTFFAEIAGISLQRLREFIDGMTPAPHYIRVLLEIFAVWPDSIDTAEWVTDTFSRSRREAEKEKEATP